MTAEQREMVRVQLALLADKAPAGFGVDLAVVTLTVAGFANNDRAAIEKEIAYLADKNFLKAAAKAVSPENKRWQITAAGRDWLAEQGLA